MKLKLDENLGNRGAALLRRAGHDVATVREQGLQGAADAALIEVCRKEGRCLVTLDLDFSNPLRFPPTEYSGIAVLRPPARMTPSDLLLCIATLINGLRERSITGRLWTVQPGRVREYEEPTGDDAAPSGL